MCCGAAWGEFAEEEEQEQERQRVGRKIIIFFSFSNCPNKQKKLFLSSPRFRHSLLRAAAPLRLPGAAPRRDERENELRGPEGPRGGRGHGRDCFVGGIDALAIVVDCRCCLFCRPSPRPRRRGGGPPPQPQARAGRDRGAVCLAEAGGRAGKEEEEEEGIGMRR